MQSATVRGYPAATAASRFLYGAVAARSARSPWVAAGASATADPMDCTGPGAWCVHALSSAAAPITRETSRNVVRNRYLGVRAPTGSDGQRSRLKELELPAHAYGRGHQVRANASSAFSYASSPANLAIIRFGSAVVRRTCGHRVG